MAMFCVLCKRYPSINTRLVRTAFLLRPPLVNNKLDAVSSALESIDSHESYFAFARDCSMFNEGFEGESMPFGIPMLNDLWISAVMDCDHLPLGSCWTPGVILPATTIPADESFDADLEDELLAPQDPSRISPRVLPPTGPTQRCYS